MVTVHGPSLSNFLQHFKKSFRRPIRNKESALTNDIAPGLELVTRPWTSAKDDRNERRQTRARALRATKPQPHRHADDLSKILLDAVWKRIVGAEQRQRSWNIDLVVVDHAGDTVISDVFRIPEA